MTEKKCPYCGSTEIDEEDLYWVVDNEIICAEAFCCECEKPFVVRYKVELLDCKKMN